MLPKKNVEIIEEFRIRIARLGLVSVLDIEPLETPIKNRPPYGKHKDGKVKFTVRMCRSQE